MKIEKKSLEKSKIEIPWYSLLCCWHWSHGPIYQGTDMTTSYMVPKRVVTRTEAFLVGCEFHEASKCKIPDGYSPEPLWTASFRIFSSLLNSAMRELLHRGRGIKRRSSWSAMCCRAESSSWFSAGWARSWKEGMDSQVLNFPICKMG